MIGFVLGVFEVGFGALLLLLLRVVVRNGSLRRSLLRGGGSWLRAIRARRVEECRPCPLLEGGRGTRFCCLIV